MFAHVSGGGSWPRPATLTVLCPPFPPTVRNLSPPALPVCICHTSAAVLAIFLLESSFSCFCPPLNSSFFISCSTPPTPHISGASIAIDRDRDTAINRDTSGSRPGGSGGEQGVRVRRGRGREGAGAGHPRSREGHQEGGEETRRCLGRGVEAAHTRACWGFFCGSWGLLSSLALGSVLCFPCTMQFVCPRLAALRGIRGAP